MDKGGGLEKFGKALLGHPQDSEAPEGFGEFARRYLLHPEPEAIVGIRWVAESWVIRQ